MTKRQKRGCAMILAGLVMVFSAMFLHLAAEKQDALAGENAQILLRQLDLNRVPVNRTPDNPAPEAEPIQDAAMPEKEYLGYSMIGTLRIPSLGIELPIMSSWSYSLLDAAPCRYAGSITEENMILMGHNYKNHFGPLRRVAIGSAVEFENVDGIIYYYTVEEVVHLHHSEGELLPSEYPLTLFTCTLGGTNRIVVRCSEAQP